MRRLVVLAIVMLVLAGCVSRSVKSGPKPTASPTVPATTSPPTVLTFQPTPAATIVEGGCGTTKVYRGGIPASLDQAGAHNNPTGLAYVVADPPIAAGFLFNYPLSAGPQGDKILWVMGAPRDGAPLAIDAHPYGASQPVASFSRGADSGPGEIYPSGLAIPSGGCWTLSLTWGTNRAKADLEYG